MSNIFEPQNQVKIQTDIVELLNKHTDFLTEISAKSTRAVGDALEEIVGKNLQQILHGQIKNYSDDFARRAMADLAFQDIDNNYYRVDVKTHRQATAFNMPNLTSVERIARFYEDDTNYFCIMLFKYEVIGSRVQVNECIFTPIESLEWDCLTIGALGWGQIQIANANRIGVSKQYSRKSWMLELCENMLSFYPKEVDKIGKRITYFEQVKEKWLLK
jgi:hypothetical protein